MASSRIRTSRANLVWASACGAYADRAAAVTRVFEAADTPRRASKPIVVANKIVEAGTTRRPRARYPVGRSAGAIVRARKLLPDAAMDAIIVRTFR